MKNNLQELDNKFVFDIRSLITNAKTRIARNINGEMTMLYWNIGKRVKEEILKDKRAKYGDEVVRKLAESLSAEYGKGFGHKALLRMIQFYDVFPKVEIVATVTRQLSWSHIIELLPIKARIQREFYAYMAIEENWSVRELRSKIHKMTYERTLANQHPDKKQHNMVKLISNEKVPNLDLVLKDPLILDFLQLPANHSESQLEDAILAELKNFILEIGSGFSFVSRQKRMTVDGDHFYLDLLFYHRKLKRLVAFELKLGKFKPEYKGQMEFYLKWLKQNESLEGEEAPIGIILCTEKSDAQIELLDPLSSGIHVAEYWTELPPPDIFERKIQEIVLRCRSEFDD